MPHMSSVYGILDLFMYFQNFFMFDFVSIYHAKGDEKYAKRK